MSSFSPTEMTLESSVQNLINKSKINQPVFKFLRNILNDLNCETNLLDSISILSLASTVPELKNVVFIKLVELLRLSKMDNLRTICYQLMHCKFLLRITEAEYFPEIIQTIQNILILFNKTTDNDRLFLPIYKLQKLKGKRNFLHHSFDDRSNLIEFNFEILVSIDFDKIEKEKLKASLFDATLDLIGKLKNRYKQLDAFESIFYFIDKLLDQLILDYPLFESKIQQIKQINDICKPRLTHLVLPRQKPKILQMLEPDYSINSMSNYQDLEQSRRKKLKRESKSIQRELKKDSAFINSIKLDETLEKDRIRKEKVKRLISEIQQERSMFKK